MGYFVTQPLAGHGYIRHYLHKMGTAASPDRLSFLGVTDSTEHAFFFLRQVAHTMALSDLWDQSG